MWLVAIGVLAIVGLGAWLALSQFWSPPTAPGVGTVEADSPFDELMSTSPAEPDPSASQTHGRESTTSAAESADLGFVQERGRLALEIGGERMGEEVYQLSHDPGGRAELVSRGRFSVKLWVASVSFNYTQRVQLTDDLQPEQYRLDLDGPLGIGNRHIRADVADGEARITTGSRSQTVSLQSDPVTFIGVLASYAFMPKLIDDRDRRSVTAIVFDVREADPSPGEPLPTVPIEITRQGPVQLDSADGGQSIQTARYDLNVLDEPQTELTMYAQNGTFVGLKGRFSHDNPPFRIYREDRLPGGFRVDSTP